MILNLIKYQLLDVGKIYLYIKNPFESKYQLLINGREKVGIKQTKKSKGRFFFFFSETIDDVYENLEKIHKRKKMLKVFDKIIADRETNEKLRTIVTER